MTKTLTTTRLRIVYFVLFVHSYFIHFCKTQAPCAGNGLTSCACNFIKACEWNSITKKFSVFKGSKDDLDKFIPRGLNVLAKNPTKVAEICELGLIGIFYDCENRIPIASTLVLTADQYNYVYRRPRYSFRYSSNIENTLQQNNKDYKDSNSRLPCYETHYIKRINYVEHWWYRAITDGTMITARSEECSKIMPPKTGIAKGHLIAASYGRGSSNRIRKTFVYTNAVPQFAKLNSGQWSKFEGKLIRWAKENCKEAPLHIIVGTVPSTFGVNEERYFGEAGFSDFINFKSEIYPEKQPYRVNVPAYMWTAACCHSPSLTRSTAFFAINHPGLDLVKSIPFSELFLRIQDHPSGPAKDIIFFPEMPSCHNAKNFVKI